MDTWNKAENYPSSSVLFLGE
jgi:hypothetical protein